MLAAVNVSSGQDGRTGWSRLIGVPGKIGPGGAGKTSSLRAAKTGRLPYGSSPDYGTVWALLRTTGDDLGREAFQHVGCCSCGIIVGRLNDWNSCPNASWRYVMLYCRNLAVVSPADAEPGRAVCRTPW
jgi:hypothetical protein